MKKKTNKQGSACSLDYYTNQKAAFVISIWYYFYMRQMRRHNTSTNWDPKGANTRLCWQKLIFFISHSALSLSLFNLFCTIITFESGGGVNLNFSLLCLSFCASVWCLMSKWDEEKNVKRVSWPSSTCTLQSTCKTYVIVFGWFDD